MKVGTFSVPPSGRVRGRARPYRRVLSGRSSETRYCSILMNPDGSNSWGARDRAPCSYANERRP
jgi:hypothetical protein